MSEERRKILDMVAGGKISPEQAASLLELVSAPDEGQSTPPDQSEPPGVQETQAAVEPAPSHPAEAPPRLRWVWMYPMGAGVMILLVGATVVTSMRQQGRVNAWTWLCGWIPLFVGLTIVTVAAWARTAHWIHVRVRDHGKRISLSLPLPLGLAAAVVRLARPYVRQLRDTAVDEAILALREGLQGNEDIIIDVRDDEEGEHVQIDFGGQK